MMMASRQRHRAKNVIGWHQLIRSLGTVGKCFDVPVTGVKVRHEEQGGLVGMGLNDQFIGLIRDQLNLTGGARFRVRFGFAFEQNYLAWVKRRIAHGGKKRISSDQDFLVGD